MHSGSPHIRAIDGRDSPYLSAIAEPEIHSRSSEKRKFSPILLRVDAYLGEWLSPEYFDKITPPPESKMMVASAKADLLHDGESIQVTNISSRSPTGRGNFPGGWNSESAANSMSQDAADPLVANVPNHDPIIPRLGRANSHSVGSLPRQYESTFNRRAERSPTPESPTYKPPIPSYAISPSQPIPTGYVFHARDACVKVDSLWDSLRPPLEWGSGGDHGEEWSAMHKRFRKGLHKMISWYQNHDDSETLRPIKDDFTENETSYSRATEDNDDDDETDTVLVLVTHGAGCNALIGALTNQPVLLDVGMASLTMAVRKNVGYKRVSSPQSEDVPDSPSRQRRSLIDLGISEDYEVKITASTEHLRAGSPFLGGQQLQRTPSLPVREKSPYRYERPGFVNSHHPRLSGSKEEFHPDNSTNDKFGELQRSSTTIVRSKGGLWSKPVPKVMNKQGEQDDMHSSPATNNVSVTAGKLDGTLERVDLVRHERLNGSTTSGGNSPNGIHDHVNQGPSVAPSGLWGAPPQALGTERDQGSKRRWTLSHAT